METYLQQRPAIHSPYMEFAKLHSAARFNLATSAVENYPLSQLIVRVEDLELNGSSPYGYGPLLEALGRLKGVSADRIVHSMGTSMANHLVMATLLAPGDEVLIEEPAYQLLLTTAKYLGARVCRFNRPVEDKFRIDLEELQNRISSSTRLIVLTNLHSPSSTRSSREVLRSIGEIAEKCGAYVLVDEVYLEALFSEPADSACHLGSRFVVTTSLTKAYGLGTLRCGWIVAEPQLARRIWRLNDLFGSTAAHAGEVLSLRAIENLDKIARRARNLLESNRDSLRDILGDHPAIHWEPTDGGTTVFPKLVSGEATSFCQMLMDRYETSVVPGRYFECPDHFRIGIGGDQEMTRQGLTRLRDGLTAWHAR